MEAFRDQFTDIASVGDIGESSGRTTPGILTSDSDMLASDSDMLASDVPPSPADTRSYGKAEKTKKDR